MGHLNHPSKTITEEDEDSNAHLQTGQPKVINYIGSSKSHASLMRGKTLEVEKGLTAAAFNLSLDDEEPQAEPQAGEEGGADVPPGGLVKEKKEKFVYVPNVVKNESIHYFRLPKLGSYIAVPLQYNSYLKETIFDAALDAKLK